MTFRLFLLFVAVLFGARYLAQRDAGGTGPEPWEGRYPLHSSSSQGDGEHWVGIETRDGVMGTRFSAEVYASGEETGRSALRAAWRRIHDLEAKFSTWIPSSLASLVNREAGRRPVTVDLAFLRVLDICREVHRESDGTFDPTVGPLLRVWKPLATLKTMPPETDVRRARELVGLDKVVVDRAARTVSFPADGMALDFGGVVKGLAAQEATAAAILSGADSCRVNAGGDMYAAGDVFEVSIRDPDGGPGDVLPDSTFRVRDAGVATSGNYERYTEIDGKRYSHILDPRTGRPVPDAVVQVTVIAPSGARADALATALTVLGVEDGLNLANRLRRVEALFLVREGGEIARRATPTFPGILR
ncbi:MAG: FAD:protein FMN transferase [Planctomycetota bacterium]